MNKVLIPTKLSDVAANTLKTAGYEVIQDADTPLEKQVAAHPDAVALIVRSEKVTPEIMDALPSLKLVVRAGAGYDNIDIVYARKKNVDVMNTPGANSNAVAEEVMAMILAYYRHIVQADATTREGLDELISKAGMNVKNLPMRQVITSFAGLRAHEDQHEFVIKELEDCKGFIDCAGIESPRSHLLPPPSASGWPGRYPPSWDFPKRRTSSASARAFWTPSP